ncbi:MAG: hypothetical protein HYS38_05835, partial [Acidobacteria bacterium]|nr:hypothetical protein [Acidobacteriota bacterium]
MTTLEFLNLLWQYKPEDLYILIWTLADKRSHWYQEIPPAAKFVTQQKGRDVYVGVGLAARDYGPAHRCGSDEIAGIAGFWADFDLRSDAHSKKALPATIPDAISIIPASMPPTVVVSTGNGAHAWWLFKEPFVFDSDQERKDTARLIARWQTLLRLRASQRGWAFDRLSDLARVLRIPGTVNAKDPGNPKQVTVHSTADRRFNLSDLEEFLDEAAIPDPEGEERAAREWAERFKDVPLVINLDTKIPEDMLQRWIDLDMRFRNTWFRQRHDLKDQTQSGYDLALADFGVDAGLSEQQIVDLIIHHRTVHKQKQRTRPDYFQRTISKAASRSPGIEPLRASPPPEPSPTKASQLQSPESENTASAGETGGDKPVDPVTVKAVLCGQISAILGVRVLRLVKLTGKEPVYRMELEQGKIEFASVAKLIDQHSVRVAIAAAVDRLIPKIKPKAWEQLAQMMLDACVVEEGSEEMEFEGAARMYVAQYLAETAFIPSVEAQTVQNARKPTV